MKKKRKEGSNVYHGSARYQLALNVPFPCSMSALHILKTVKMQGINIPPLLFFKQHSIHISTIHFLRQSTHSFSSINSCTANLYLPQMCFGGNIKLLIWFLPFTVAIFVFSVRGRQGALLESSKGEENRESHSRDTVSFK